ncbi:MAG: YihY/virulence factor BrkB family protein [Pseudonocardiaceae bacterium]
MDNTSDACAAGTSPVDAESATDARSRRGPLRLIWRTLVKTWDDEILGMSAQAAFWMTLSLPPLLLGLLGSLGFVSRLFGQDTINLVQRQILQLAATVFTPTVVDQIIRPTVTNILTTGHSSIVSVGFVLSLWAGSSALASLVDSITAAYQQHTVRNPVWQRTFALLLYVVLLMGSMFVLPLVALGPGVLPDLFPISTRPTVAHLVGVFYYPVMAVLLVAGLATLYKIVLPNKPPWHRGLPGALLAMVVFLVSSETLRRYIAWVTSTGYTYGALATPIAYLLFSFFIAMAIVLGAEFNYAIAEMWPARPTRRERQRWRRLGMARFAERARVDAPAATGTRPTKPPAQDAPSPADTTRTIELPRNGRADTEHDEAATAPDPPSSASGRSSGR